MVFREAITYFLDELLHVSKVHDAAQNGLQVEGRQMVKKIAFGVSASEQLFLAAAREKADMVIVHHGLFWNEGIRVTGSMKKRLAPLLAGDISLLAYHLPLDKHPVYGNNARLLHAVGAKNLVPFGAYKGELIGFSGRLPRPQAVGELAARLEAFCGAPALALFRFGGEKVDSVAAVSGGGGEFMTEAVAASTGLFITGEAPEPAQEYCRESGLNYLALGHYNSEKAGVQALRELLKKKFAVETVFIDCPNKF